jgi:hypothetical protein
MHRLARKLRPQHKSRPKEQIFNMSKRTSLPLLAAAAFCGLAFAAAIAQANVVTTGSAAFTVTDDVPKAITGGPSDLLGSVTLSNFAFSGGGHDIYNAASNYQQYERCAIPLGPAHGLRL